MKKIVLTMVALLSMTAVQAQESESKGDFKAPKAPTAEQITSRMAKDLDLTDAQQAKVLELNKQYKDVFKGPRMGGPRPPKHDGKMGERKGRPDAESGATEQHPGRPELTDAQKAEMKQQKAKREEYDKQLKQILTDEQYKSYKKLHHRGHGPRGHHGERPQPMEK